jgi:hypothetical protein
MKNKVCAVLIEVTHHSDGVSLCGDMLELNEKDSVEREVYTKNDFKKPRQKNFDEFMKNVVNCDDYNLPKSDSIKVTFLTAVRTVNLAADETADEQK